MFYTPKRRYGIKPMTFVPPNYFGNGSDGPYNYTASVFTPNAAGDMIVKNYTNVDIGEGYGLYVNSPCSGILIYSLGDIILSGSIDMRGESYVGTGSKDAILFRISTITGSSSVSASNMTIYGSAAASSENNQNYSWYANGINRIIYVSGSAGGLASLGNPINGRSGSNAANSCAGGGGGGYYDGYRMGGNGISGSYSGGGKGGYGGGTGNGYFPPGGDGGGNIILIAKGNVTITSTGTIRADGLNGTGAPPGGTGGAGGGGGGGGTITILYGGTFTNNGIISANGGLGGYKGDYGTYGGNGGSGSIYINKINI